VQTNTISHQPWQVEIKHQDSSRQHASRTCRRPPQRTPLKGGVGERPVSPTGRRARLPTAHNFLAARTERIMGRQKSDPDCVRLATSILMTGIFRRNRNG
jgi:hypothetical protein